MVAHTLQALEYVGTKANALRVLFIGCEMNELASQITSTDTISDIFEIIQKRNYWNFFNYELLGIIINCFCKDNPTLVRELADYISKFEVYCQHRISDVACAGLFSSYNCEQTNEKLITAQMYFTSITKVTLKTMKDIQWKIQVFLNVGPLQLVDVSYRDDMELRFKCLNKIGQLCLSEVQKDHLDADDDGTGDIKQLRHGNKVLFYTLQCICVH